MKVFIHFDDLEIDSSEKNDINKNKWQTSWFKKL